MADKWSLEKFRSYDKRIKINGPLPLIIDFDDVDQVETLHMVKAVVDTLNQHWTGEPKIVETWNAARKAFYENFEGDWDSKRFRVGATGGLDLAEACEALEAGKGNAIFDATGELVYSL